MEISLIVATDFNGGIGKDGGMPWGMSLKKDLKFFSGKTSGCNIIMGIIYQLVNYFQLLMSSFGGVI